jgi:hypothetical protein
MLCCSFINAEILNITWQVLDVANNAIIQTIGNSRAAFIISVKQFQGRAT